jgi:hypothetical protein
MAKTVMETVRLPKQTVDALRVISKRAGLSIETVIKLVLAMESLKWGAQEKATHP